MPAFGPPTGGTASVMVNVPVPTPVPQTPKQPQQPMPQQAMAPQPPPSPFRMLTKPPAHVILPFAQNQAVPQKMRRDGSPVRYSHDAFSRTIEADRNSTVAPLIYADWLGENGLPGAEEIIRRHTEHYGAPSLSEYVTPEHSPRDWEQHRPNTPFVEFYGTINDKQTGEPRHIVIFGHQTSRPERYLKWSSGAVSEEDAHRLLSGMPGIPGAELAKTNLEKRYPYLKNPERMKRSGQVRRYMQPVDPPHFFNRALAGSQLEYILRSAMRRSTMGHVDPIAPFAQKILSGDINAMGPLADFVEETNHPLGRAMDLRWTWKDLHDTQQLLDAMGEHAPDLEDMHHALNGNPARRGFSDDTSHITRSLMLPTGIDPHRIQHLLNGVAYRHMQREPRSLFNYDRDKALALTQDLLREHERRGRPIRGPLHAGHLPQIAEPTAVMAAGWHSRQQGQKPYNFVEAMQMGQRMRHTPLLFHDVFLHPKNGMRAVNPNEPLPLIGRSSMAGAKHFAADPLDKTMPNRAVPLPKQAAAPVVEQPSRSDDAFKVNAMIPYFQERLVDKLLHDKLASDPETAGRLKTAHQLFIHQGNFPEKMKILHVQPPRIQEFLRGLPDASHAPQVQAKLAKLRHWFHTVAGVPVGVQELREALYRRHRTSHEFPERPLAAQQHLRMSRSQNWVGQKIKKLLGEGKPHKQAIAIALSMAGRANKQRNAREKVIGGLGDNRPDSYFNPEQLAAGIQIELEHTNDPAIAKEIAKDHLTEDAQYYLKLKQVERNYRRRFSRYTPQLNEAHESIRGTRVARALKHLVDTHDIDEHPIGEAAFNAFKMGPTDANMHALSSALHEEGHPLATAYNWKEIPRKVELDRKVVEELNRIAGTWRPTGTDRDNSQPLLTQLAFLARSNVSHPAVQSLAANLHIPPGREHELMESLQRLHRHHWDRDIVSDGNVGAASLDRAIDRTAIAPSPSILYDKPTRYSHWEEGKHPRDHGKFATKQGAHPPKDAGEERNAEETRRGVLSRSIGFVKGLASAAIKRIEQRYGPGTARAVKIAVLVGQPIPLPAASLMLAAPLVAFAEMRRQIAGGPVRHRMDCSPLRFSRVRDTVRRYMEHGMSDEAALHRTIRDEGPHASAPSLVYADWLDEHNQPERAHFLRTAHSEQLPHIPEAEFHKHIAAKPEDPAAHFAYANWLDAHGKPATASLIRASIANLDPNQAIDKPLIKSLTTYGYPAFSLDQNGVSHDGVSAYRNGQVMINRPTGYGDGTDLTWNTKVPTKDLKTLVASLISEGHHPDDMDRELYPDYPEIEEQEGPPEGMRAVRDPETGAWEYVRDPHYRREYARRGHPLRFAFGHGNPNKMGGFRYNFLHLLMGPKTEHKLGNTSVLRRRGNDIQVILHKTPVVTAHPDGTFTLATRGWNTPTTHRYISGFSPARPFSKSGQPMLDSETPLFDGIRIDQQGRPIHKMAKNPDQFAEILKKHFYNSLVHPLAPVDSKFTDEMEGHMLPLGFVPERLRRGKPERFAKLPGTLEAGRSLEPNRYADQADVRRPMPKVFLPQKELFQHLANKQQGLVLPVKDEGHLGQFYSPHDHNLVALAEPETGHVYHYGEVVQQPHGKSLLLSGSPDEHGLRGPQDAYYEELASLIRTGHPPMNPTGNDNDYNESVARNWAHADFKSGKPFDSFPGHRRSDEDPFGIIGIVKPDSKEHIEKTLGADQETLKKSIRHAQDSAAISGKTFVHRFPNPNYAGLVLNPPNITVVAHPDGRSMVFGSSPNGQNSVMPAPASRLGLGHIRDEHHANMANFLFEAAKNKGLLATPRHPKGRMGNLFESAIRSVQPPASGEHDWRQDAIAAVRNGAYSALPRITDWLEQQGVHPLKVAFLRQLAKQIPKKWRFQRTGQPERFREYGLDQPITTVGFSSPNTGTMKAPEAMVAMGTARHRNHRQFVTQLMRSLGVKHSTLDALGDWSPSPTEGTAESSVVHVVHSPMSPDVARYAAARIGEHAKQLAVLNFNPHPGGEDSLFRFFVPTTNVEALRNFLTERTIFHRTIIPDRHRPGFTVLVFDKPSWRPKELMPLPEAVYRATQELKTNVQQIPGTGDTIDQPDYAKILASGPSPGLAPERGEASRLSARHHDPRRRTDDHPHRSSAGRRDSRAANFLKRFAAWPVTIGRAALPSHVHYRNNKLNHPSADPDLMPHLSRFFGRPVTLQQIEALASHMPDHGLTIEPWQESGTESINLASEGKNGHTHRILKKNKNGTITLHNEQIHVYTTSPVRGAQLLARQVQAARELGIRRILVELAVRKRDQGKFGTMPMNGHYTWPRLGFNGVLRKHQYVQLPEEFQRQLKGNPELHALFSLKGGPEWWKHNGSTAYDLEFDTHPDSEHSRRLDAYMQAKHGEQPHAATPEREQQPVSRLERRSVAGHHRNAAATLPVDSGSGRLLAALLDRTRQARHRNGNGGTSATVGGLVRGGLRRFAFDPANSDEAGFHRTLHANSNDSTASMIYADLLEETGRPALADAIRRHNAENGNGAFDVEGWRGQPGKAFFETVPFIPSTKDGQLDHAKHGYTIHVRMRSLAQPERTLGWFFSVPKQHAEPIVLGLLHEHHHPTEWVEREFPHLIDEYRKDRDHGFGLEDPNYNRRLQRQRFAKYRSPTGGVVHQGTYYPGGRMIPDDGLPGGHPAAPVTQAIVPSPPELSPQQKLAKWIRSKIASRKIPKI